MKNKKIFFSSIGIIILTLIISIFAFIPIDKCHDDYGKTWLKNVGDNIKITDVSLPGTHDSGATHSIADVAGKCQDISIKTQLDIGVRFFDLRLQLVNDEFKIVHSFVDQNLKFSSVVDDMYNFIKENSSEFLIISVKQEKNNVNSSLSFDEAFIRDLKEYKDIFKYEDRSFPSTIGEARGKIYILSRFSSEIGIDAYGGWKDDCAFEYNNMYIQDNYNIQDIEEKKSDILTAINLANRSDKIVLNFTSCYLDPGFPPSYAGTAALAINPWFKETIKENNDKLGIIVADFITEDLSKTIYMRNIK